MVRGTFGGSFLIGIVHVGSLRRLWVWHVVVMVVKTSKGLRLVLVFVNVEISVMVTFAGVLVAVCMRVAEGTVTVSAGSVDTSVVVVVVLTMVVGMIVYMNVAVGVIDVVDCGPTFNVKTLWYAKSKPRVMMIQVPDSMSFLFNS